ncbi:hypothetical protein ACFX13_018675 [Malus domestica]
MFMSTVQSLWHPRTPAAKFQILAHGARKPISQFSSPEVESSRQQLLRIGIACSHIMGLCLVHGACT